MQSPDATPQPAQKTQGFFQRHSLQLAGILNLIGDGGFLRSGFRTKDPYKIVGGSLYTAGGANLAFLGSVKPEQRRYEVSRELADFLKRETGHVGTDSTLATHLATQPQSFSNTLRSNAASNTLLAYTAGAAAMFASGLKKKQAGLGSAGFYYGLSSLIFKTASLLIPEKVKKETDEKPRNIVEWIQEKPLRVFGYGSLVTDSLLAWDTYQDYKNDPKSQNYLWSGLTAATYILADIMIAISSKNPVNAAGPIPKADQMLIERMAADAIAREPRHEQAALLQHVSEFLSDRPEMAGSPKDIAASIEQHMQALHSSSWADRMDNRQQNERSVSSRSSKFC